MRKINNRAIILIIVIFLYLLASFFFILNKSLKIYVNIINPVFWFVILIFCILLFKNEKVNKKYKFDILQKVIINLVIFFLIYYLLGLFIGFSSTPYNKNIFSIIKNVFIYGSVIVFQEYIRQIFINRSGKNKKILVLITLLFIVSDLVKNILMFNFSSGEKIFETIITYINPIIIKNILLTYLTYLADFMPSLIYSFILAIYVFIVPIVPNLNWFLMGVVEILLPFLTLINIKKFYEKREFGENKKYFKHKNKNYITTILVIIIMLLAILVSGKIKYQLIAIGSNSMTTVFSKGDAILIEYLDSNEIKKLDIGDIIVYYSDNKIIVHRIIEKEKLDNDNYIFKTKGDNNKDPDYGYIEEDQIIAKYKLDIPIIGYPTIWVRETLFK